MSKSTWKLCYSTGALMLLVWCGCGEEQILFTTQARQTPWLDMYSQDQEIITIRDYQNKSLADPKSVQQLLLTGQRQNVKKFVLWSVTKTDTPLQVAAMQVKKETIKADALICYFRYTLKVESVSHKGNVDYWTIELTSPREASLRQEAMADVMNIEQQDQNHYAIAYPHMRFTVGIGAVPLKQREKILYPLALVGLWLEKYLGIYGYDSSLKTSIVIRPMHFLRKNIYKMLYAFPVLGSFWGISYIKNTAWQPRLRRHLQIKEPQTKSHWQTMQMSKPVVCDVQADFDIYLKGPHASSGDPRWVTSERNFSSNFVKFFQPMLEAKKNISMDITIYIFQPMRDEDMQKALAVTHSQSFFPGIVLKSIKVCRREKDNSFPSAQADDFFNVWFSGLRATPQIGSFSLEDSAMEHYYAAGM